MMLLIFTQCNRDIMKYKAIKKDISYMLKLIEHFHKEKGNVMKVVVNYFELSKYTR